MKSETSMSNTSAQRKEKKVEISFYRKNSGAYNLALLSVLAEFVYVVTVLDQMAVNYLMGAVTMMNIALLFLLFTVGIKMNVYSEKWTKIGFGIAAYFAFRIVVLLPFVVQPLDKFVQIYGAAGISLALLLVACVQSQIIITRRNKRKEAGDA
ncbi:MAG: hypothetical protein R3Y06_09055 [Faecalibacterium sp.]